MAIRFTDDTYYQEIADAIRAQLGTTLKISPPEMATEIGRIGGGENDIVNYLTGEEIDLNSDAVTTIKERAFKDPKFKNLIVPNCTSIGYAAMPGAYISGDYDFSNVTEINSFAFSRTGDNYVSNYDLGGIGIVDLVLPKCQAIGAGAFNNMSYLRRDGTEEPKPLKTVSAPACTRIDNSAFKASITNKGSLESVNFPAVTYLSDSIFLGNPRLAKFETEGEITTIGSQLFSGCTGLTRFSAKNINFRATLTNYVFRDCSSLEYADVGSVQSLQTESFKNCTSLNYLILRRTQGSTPYTTMSNSNALSTSRLATGEGFILVPSSLMETYKTATNWSVYAGQFRALEDYTVDGTITGDLDETKLENIA